MGYQYVSNPEILQVIAEIAITVQVADKNFVQVRARDFQSYKIWFVAYFSDKCTWQMSAMIGRSRLKEIPNRQQY